MIESRNRCPQVRTYNVSGIFMKSRYDFPLLRTPVITLISPLCIRLIKSFRYFSRLISIILLHSLKISGRCAINIHCYILYQSKNQDYYRKTAPNCTAFDNSVLFLFILSFLSRRYNLFMEKVIHNNRQFTEWRFESSSRTYGNPLAAVNSFISSSSCAQYVRSFFA